MSFEITTAERTSAPLSVYIEGESGSGKTYSALLLARGLAGYREVIGIIDTEGGRSLIYADDPDIGGFEHMRFDAPYSPERFIEALKIAVAAGWKAVVIDSASLEHDGEGGLLDMAEKEYEALLKKNPNNRAADIQKWTSPKVAHKRFLNFAVGLPIHVIMCFRQTLTTDMKSKSSVLTTVAEKNTKFYLELHATIRADHTAEWTLVPKPYQPAIQQSQLITTQTGRMLMELNSGKQISQPAGQPASPDPQSAGDERGELIIEVLNLIESTDPKISRAQLEGALSDLYNKPTTLETIPIKGLRTLATENGFAKTCKHV